jgi:adenylate kinase
MAAREAEVVLLMGPPGAGKGTQATLLAAERGLQKLSTGDMLRDNVERGTELGRQAQAFMDAGDLVPDDVIVGMVGSAFETAAAFRFLLDGFPRTAGQAAALDALLAEHGVHITAALVLDVDDEELVRRLLARAALEGRSDDTEDVVRNRMDVYRRQTQPLIDYYAGQGRLHRVDGRGSVDEIAARLRRRLVELDGAAGDGGDVDAGDGAAADGAAAGDGAAGRDERGSPPDAAKGGP